MYKNYSNYSKIKGTIKFNFSPKLSLIFARLQLYNWTIPIYSLIPYKLRYYTTAETQKKEFRATQTFLQCAMGETKANLEIAQVKVGFKEI